MAMRRCCTSIVEKKRLVLTLYKIFIVFRNFFLANCRIKFKSTFILRTYYCRLNFRGTSVSILLTYSVCDTKTFWRIFGHDWWRCWHWFLDSNWCTFFRESLPSNSVSTIYLGNRSSQKISLVVHETICDSHVVRWQRSRVTCFDLILAGFFCFFRKFSVNNIIWTNLHWSTDISTKEPSHCF